MYEPFINKSGTAQDNSLSSLTVTVEPEAFFYPYIKPAAGKRILLSCQRTAKKNQKTRVGGKR